MKDTLFCGRYRVVRRLGTGGTATVYLAQDDRLDRLVAVKRLHGAEVTEETAERLRREARIMASLHHPNLVTVLDMLTEDEDLFLIMEYVDGETLASVLDDAPLAPERVLALLRPVAAALDHAHSRGIVHRDVKPSNILVSRRGTVKLADLGLATAAEITRITPPGSIVGTPAYMAPEQAQPAPCTPAVDVFALGSIAFEALSGTPPRTGRTAVAILREASSRPPPDLRARRPGTSAAAAEALARAMAAEPAARQTSAGELIAELEAGLAEEAEPARPPAAAAAEPDAPPVPGRSAADARLRRLIAPLAVAAAIAVVVAVVLVARGDTGGSDAGRRAAASPAADTATATRTATRTAAATPRRTPTAMPSRTPVPSRTPAATPSRTPAAGPTSSPTATVRAFYTRAAAHDFAAAWALAGPQMRAAFGGSLASFERQLATLRRISFEELAVARQGAGAATVRLRTTATHSDHVDHCSGTLRAVRSGSRWLVEPAGLSCERD